MNIVVFFLENNVVTRSNHTCYMRDHKIYVWGVFEAFKVLQNLISVTYAVPYDIFHFIM